MKRKPKKFYAVCTVHKRHSVMVFNHETTLELNWTDGMIGVMPVFDNMADAKRYSNGKHKILELVSDRDIE